jgi:lipopolysaccharide/colanic/teichoic acid biosynthesis glycosyltransferase
MALISVLTGLTSKGPVIYKQDRVGQGGKVFTIFKFRTMIPDAEKNGPQWAAVQDKRSTPLGKLLRRTHLDELPQLINIFGGESSLVGPRPERPEFVEQLKKEVPFYDLRHLVRTGITGWAQINYRYGASVDDTYEKVQYDLYYLKNRSLVLDIIILIKTLRLFFITLR